MFILEKYIKLYGTQILAESETFSNILFLIFPKQNSCVTYSCYLFAHIFAILTSSRLFCFIAVVRGVLRRGFKREKSQGIVRVEKNI